MSTRLCVRTRGSSFELTHHQRARGGGGRDGWKERWMEGWIEGVIQQACYLSPPPPRTRTNTCLVHCHSLHFTMTRMPNLLMETEPSPELNLNGGEEDRMKRRRRVYQTSRCPLYVFCSLPVCVCVQK